jgi:hypothetical protein
MTPPKVPKVCCIDPFCHKQFPLSFPQPSSKGSSSKLSVTAEEFEHVLNDFIHREKYQLKDGYAPFCKHVFLPNVRPNNVRPNNVIPPNVEGETPTEGETLTEGRVNTLEITPANEGLIRTEYEARTPKELPVLTRYFPSESIPQDSLPPATYLDVILYSRSQIIAENLATETPGIPSQSSVPWGVVSIKLQTCDFELPMNPITAMRNAMGEEHGGSGKEIDRDEYMKAVEFWAKHAVVK